MVMCGVFRGYTKKAQQKSALSPPNINCTNNTRETNKRKHIVVSLVIAIAIILMVACSPEITRDEGGRFLIHNDSPSLNTLVATLVETVKRPTKTRKEKETKQNEIQTLLKQIKATDSAYKHKPTTKDELAMFIKAEVWGQGTGGNKNWTADLNNIDTSLITDMSHLFSDDVGKGYGLHEYSRLPMWASSKPTKVIDMYKGSKAPQPTWRSIGKLKTAVEKTPPEQNEIQTLLKQIKATDPAYKHKPTTKDELVIIIQAEVWGQGTGGNQNWKANLNNIDTSVITDMSHLFSVDSNEGYGLNLYNGRIFKWNVSSVTNMNKMFYGAKAFNQNISTWNVSSVTNMNKMFYGAKAFNQNISTWDVSSVTNMSDMFVFASAFNQDLSSWKVGSVTNMSSMFADARAFNQDLSSWKVSSVTNMSSMFAGASAFNQDLSSWKVSSVTNMSSMFSFASAFNQNISTWDVSSVTNMSSMFSFASAFDQDLNAWDKHLKNADGTTYRKISIERMFRGSKRQNNPPAWLAELKKIP